ncbi:unnamed protein product, partial [Amoebophrya sp. A120]|eukprot:GSA120T00007441001.1
MPISQHYETVTRKLEGNFVFFVVLPVFIDESTIILDLEENLHQTLTSLAASSLRARDHLVPVLAVRERRRQEEEHTADVLLAGRTTAASSTPHDNCDNLIEELDFLTPGAGTENSYSAALEQQQAGRDTRQAEDKSQEVAIQEQTVGKSLVERIRGDFENQFRGILSFDVVHLAGGNGHRVMRTTLEDGSCADTSKCNNNPEHAVGKNISDEHQQFYNANGAASNSWPFISSTDPHGTKQAEDLLELPYAHFFSFGSPGDTNSEGSSEFTSSSANSKSTSSSSSSSSSKSSTPGDHKLALNKNPNYSAARVLLSSSSSSSAFFPSCSDARSGTGVKYKVRHGGSDAFVPVVPTSTSTEEANERSRLRDVEAQQHNEALRLRRGENEIIKDRMKSKLGEFLHKAA